MSVSKIKIGESPEGKIKILRIDNLIRPELDRVKYRVKKKNWDYVALIAGLPGSGKSTLARTLARYLCKWFDEKYIAFTGDDFIEMTNNCPEYSSVILDESFASLNSKISMTGDFIKIVNHLQIIRQKHLFIFLCLPNFFDLAKGIAIFRSSHLYVTYADEKGNRGRFLVFDRRNKTKLYVRGGKFMDYNAQKANFHANFWENADIIDTENYELLKKQHMMDQSDKEVEKFAKKSGRDELIGKLHLEHGWTNKQLAELAGLDVSVINKLLAKIRKAGK
jgi:ABC-type dipeptide/oligopeptide/nickel transport system ATPase subunit